MLTSSTPVPFELPADIHEIIDSGLISADELNAEHANTKKYFVEGNPHLFVRWLPGQSVSHAMEIGQNLTEHGVNVLPYYVIEHKGEEWVVTLKVNGENLDAALAQKGDRQTTLFQQVDDTWAALAANLTAARDNGSEVSYDVEEAYQYMYGTVDVADYETPRVYLVDLPQFSWRTDVELTYSELVVHLANGIVGVEAAAANTKMKLARISIAGAIDRIDTSTEWYRQLARASCYVLDCGIRLYPDDDKDKIWDIPA